MPRSARAASVFVLLLAGLLGYGYSRVSGLEPHERTYEGAPTTLDDAGGAPLVHGPLYEGDIGRFELCWEGGTERDPLKGASVTAQILAGPGRDVAFSRPLDAAFLAGARANAEGRCVIIGRAQGVRVAGDYAIGLALPERLPEGVGEVRVRGRILHHHLLGVEEDRTVSGTLLVCLALAVCAFFAPPREASGDILLRRAAIGTGLFLAAYFGSGFIPAAGSASRLLTSLGLIGTQIALAIALAAPLGRGAGGDRASALGLVRPNRAGPFAVAAVLAAVLLVAARAFFAQLFPATGVTPVLAAAAIPSGLVVMALTAFVAPFAEELFFRGLVQGGLETRLAGAERSRKGLALSALASACFFALLHAPQTVGDRSALASIACLGLVTGALRAGSGSLAPGLLAHLLYNATLVLFRWMAVSQHPG